VSESAGRPAKVDRLYEIDSLRITAAVAVMLYHYTFANFAGGLTTTRFPGLDLVTRYGYLGVDLFFIISGFVALLTALNRKPHQFLISRTIRLYPAYWVAVTLTTVVVLLWQDGGITPFRYVSNMTMFNSLVNHENIDVVYWTLWAELRFYALILILTFIGMTKRRLTIALWAWLAISLLLKLDVLPGPADSLLTLLFQPEWSHYFIAGMAMCLIYRLGADWQLGVIVAISYVSSLPIAVDFADHVGVRYRSTMQPAAIIAIVTVAFVVMVLIALRVTRRFARSWFTTLGALTYPLYLVHDRIGRLLFQHLQVRVNKWLLTAAVAVLMCGVAWLIHRCVERPLAPIMKRLLERAWSAVSRAERATVAVPKQRSGEPASAHEERQVRD
jgi:peptidoglycan/LPS O-acetylase OafA/YrhL